MIIMNLMIIDIMMLWLWLSWSSQLCWWQRGQRAENVDHKEDHDDSSDNEVIDLMLLCNDEEAYMHCAWCVCMFCLWKVYNAWEKLQYMYGGVDGSYQTIETPHIPISTVKD